ncbi:MAG TPA: hypothetical protein VE860_25755 [Chthoniobacterales bacterium]|nr:hypothetical protein [Chthoniobacterales bacterium]
MASPRDKLLERFTRKSRLTPSEIGRTSSAQAALNELLAEGAILKLGAYYLAGREPSTQTEKARIAQLLETKRKLFSVSSLLSKKRPLKPLGRSALAELVDERVVLELPVQGKSSQLLYIHCSHVAHSESSAQTAVQQPVEERILAAYRDGSTARQRRSIPIAELVQRSGLTAAEVRSWILENGIPSHKVQLDQGDWASASEDERAAAIEQGGRQRLYIAIEP